jgi:hypothetical protein
MKKEMEAMEKSLLFHKNNSQGRVEEQKSMEKKIQILSSEVAILKKESHKLTLQQVTLKSQNENFSILVKHLRKKW